MDIGEKSIGKESFRRSARAFYEKADYKHALDLLSRVMECPPWNSDDDHIYDASKMEHPSYLPREKTIQFALQRNKWNEISIDDLKDSSSAPLILPFRDNAALKGIISTCSQHDLSYIKYSLPLLVADYYFDKAEHFRATQLYLQQSDHSGQDFIKAEAATNLLISSSNSKNKTSSLEEIAQCWRRSQGKQASKIVSKASDAFLLLQLYEDPVIVANGRSTEAYRKFGPDIIKSAFECSNTFFEELHRFSRNQFEPEVDQALRNKFRSNLIEAVQWYLHRDDKAHAEQFATTNIKNLSKEDLLAIVRRKLNPKGLIEEADRKDSLVSTYYYLIFIII